MFDKGNRSHGFNICNLSLKYLFAGHSASTTVNDQNIYCLYLLRVFFIKEGVKGYGLNSCTMKPLSEQNIETTSNCIVTL